MFEADTLIREVAARIRLRREALGFSQEALGHHAGLHRTYIGAIERGERNLTVKTLFQIAKSLGCDIRELLPPTKLNE